MRTASGAAVAAACVVISLLSYRASLRAGLRAESLREELADIEARIAEAETGGSGDGQYADDFKESLDELRKRLDGYIDQSEREKLETDAREGDASVSPPARPASGLPQGSSGESDGREIVEPDTPLGEYRGDETESEPALEAESGAENGDESGAAPDTVSAGDKITVTVSSDSAGDVYGYQFALNYDSGAFRFDGGLRSLVPGIDSIFSREFDDYLLVGATMIGDKPGAAFDGSAVCSVELTALRDAELDGITVSSVNRVSSDLGYTQNVSGWSAAASAAVADTQETAGA
jgi:hypothetical protein